MMCEQQSTSEVVNIRTADNKPKWSYISQYFEQLCNTSTKNLIFKCLLCGPKEKRISTSNTSNSNLRTHIKVCKLLFKTHNSVIIYYVVTS